MRGLAPTSEGFPEPEALDRALKRGFTTIVIRRDEGLPFGREILNGFRCSTRGDDGRLALVATSATMTAYVLRDTAQ